MIHRSFRSYRPLVAVALGALFASALACGGDAEPAADEQQVVASKLDALESGWNTIQPGGETVCSDGSPFEFYVRPGSADAKDEKVHFYLEGGGACWSGATCDLEGQPTYSPIVNDTDGQASTGVFNATDERNPLRDYTTIFVPYCGGDVHLGDRTAEYTAPATDERPERTITIEHHGVDNGRAALDWLADHFDAPETVFVSGSSAGSIPSPVYAAWIAQQFPEARVAQLGDGAGGYRGGSAARPHEQWGMFDAIGWPELEEHGDDISFEDLYVAAAKRAPSVQYAQYDTAEDDVQRQFLALSGRGGTSLQPLLDANHVEIRESNPDFRAFVAGGELHTILRRPEVYTYRVGDDSFLDWLTDLVEGRPLADVHCADCTLAEGEIPEAEAANPAEAAD